MKASEATYLKFDTIPTGYASLDKILGVGGIPTKKITEISGAFSVGKSTLALSIVGAAQKLGMECLWVDAEFSFDLGYAQTLGVDVDELELLAERFAEQNLDNTELWIAGDKDGKGAHKNALVVIDSIGGLLPRQEAEKSADGKVIGGQARIIGTFCRKVAPLLAINNVALIVLNHEFTDIMTNKLTTSGGAKLGYHKSLWIRLKKDSSKRVMKGDRQVGDLIDAEVWKNKLADTKMMKTKMTLIYGEGFAKGADLMQEALDKGILSKKGQFYFFNGERVARGQNGLRELFKEEQFAANIKALL